MTFGEKQHDIIRTVNLPRCMNRACSEATDTLRTWKREKRGENNHKRNIFASITNQNKLHNNNLPLKNI